MSVCAPTGWVVALATLIGLWALPGSAAQTTAPFQVSVNLNGSSGPVPEPCTVMRVGAFGATVTVSCSADGLRYVTRPPVSEPLRDSEAQGEAGIVTRWRKIRIGAYDYLEMTVRW
jgi:hypothetical protein